MNTQTKGPRVDRSDIERFVAALPKAPAKPVTAEVLCWRLGVAPAGRVTTDNERRIIRALRQAAVDAGVVVCGGNDGYFLPTCLDDVRASQKRRKGQIVTMARGMSAELKLAAAMFERQHAGGQLVLAW